MSKNPWGFPDIQKHETTVRAYLRGETVEPARLWLSVGYFSDGAGRNYLNEKRPFTQEEWWKLLRDTGRPTNDYYFIDSAVVRT